MGRLPNSVVVQLGPPLELEPQRRDTSPAGELRQLIRCNRSGRLRATMGAPNELSLPGLPTSLETQRAPGSNGTPGQLWGQSPRRDHTSGSPQTHSSILDQAYSPRGKEIGF